MTDRELAATILILGAESKDLKGKEAKELLKQVEEEITKQLESKLKNGVLHSVIHSYYQVVYNSYDDNIEEVTSPLPTLERAKKALEANKAYFDEDMYIIAKINCG